MSCEGEVVLVQGRAVAFTKHALRRYRQRAGGSPEGALRLAAERGVVQFVRPGWFLEGAAGSEAHAWLVLPRRVVFPLKATSERDRNREVVEFVATTCLVHRRLSKVDARWRREQAAEDATAA